MTEGTTTAATSTSGNVFAGGSANDVADRIGADTTPTPVTAVSFGAAIGTVGAPLAGSYGSLTLNADGSYGYALDNANATVNALRNGQSLIESFGYTITDADGDTSSTTLTITLHGSTDGAPAIVPVDGNGSGATGQVTVNESGLASAGDASETNTGTVTLTAAEGLSSIDIGGSHVTLAQLANLAGEPVVINTAKGTLALTSYLPISSVGGVSTSGTLSYSYTLTQVQNTPDATENQDDIALTITDAGGGMASGTLTVQIIDDLPTANADTNAVAEGSTTAPTSTSGNVFAAGSSGDVADRLGADITPTPVTAVSFGATNGMVGASLTANYGSLTLNADGSYSYTLDNANAAVNALRQGQTLTETFGYAITDADGDTSSATLTITIYGSTDGAPSIMPVDGNGGATGHVTVSEPGLTTPADTSETGTGTLTLTAADGLSGISVGGTALTAAQLTALGGAPVVIDTPKGTLTLTGYESTSAVGGVSTGGTLSYGYTLTQAQNTPNAAENQDDIALAISDAGGGTAGGILTVRIIDDVPSTAADANSIFEDAAAVSGNVFAANGASAGDQADRIGADGPAAPVSAVSFGGNSHAVGSAFDSAYGRLLLNTDGSYSYTLDNANAAVQALAPGQTLTEVFGYTITDADGDASSTTLTLTINGINDVPAGSDNTLATLEDTPLVIATADFGFTDPVDAPAHGFQSVVITTLPAAGTLTLNGVAVTAGQEIARADLDAGRLSWTPPHDLSGNDVASLSFQVRDSGAAANGGADLDPTPNTLTFNVAPVSDTPTLAAPDSVTTEVDQAVVLPIDGAQTDVDGSEDVSIRIADIPAGAVITADGVAVAIIDGRADIPVPASGVVPAIALTPPPGSDVDFVLRVSSVSQDGTADEAVTTQSLAVTINPLPPPAPAPVPPAPEVPEVVPPTEAKASSSSSGGKSSGSSDDGAGSAFAIESHIDDPAHQLTLRTGLPPLQMDQGSQGAGGESRKLESTDRGFPVERLQMDVVKTTTVQDQQKGGDRLFVYNGIKSTAAQVGQSLDYRVPKDAFGHTNTGAIVQLEASLADGAPLPEWMDFDPTSGTFSGRPPADARGTFEVKVTARDDQGREVTSNFKLQVEGSRIDAGNGKTTGEGAQNGEGKAKPAGDDAPAKPEPGADAATPEERLHLASDKPLPAKRGTIPFSDQLKLVKRDPLIDKILAQQKTRTGHAAAQRLIG